MKKVIRLTIAVLILVGKLILAGEYRHASCESILLSINPDTLKELMTQPLAPHDELLDLVDHNDQVVMTVPRSYVIEHHRRNFRLICCLLKNDKGELFIVRRAATKKAYPSALATVGGCVQAGETYQQAFAREIKEEIGIDVTQVPHVLCGFANPWDDDTMGFTAFYEIHTNQTPLLNPHDFDEGFWITPAELRERIKKGEKTTHNVPILLAKFYQQ